MQFPYGYYFDLPNSFPGDAKLIGDVLQRPYFMMFIQTKTIADDNLVAFWKEPDGSFDYAQALLPISQFLGCPGSIINE